MTARPAAAHEGAHPWTISARVARGLVSFLEQRGVSRAAFLHSAQINAEALSSADARLTRREICALAEVALEMTGDPALGLHWIETLADRSFNPLADLILHAATLREGLEALLHFHPLLSDCARFQLTEHANLATMRRVHVIGDSPRLQRFTSEIFAAGFSNLLRTINPGARIEEVRFEYAAPSYRAEYARVFRGAQSFDRMQTAVVFDRALLDAPSFYRDEAVYDALCAVAERHLINTQQASIALRVRKVLMENRSARLSDMATVARTLGLSLRTLRRRLAEEGVSYTSIANEARARVAKHHLIDERRTIQETAYEMGFSGPRAFHRAFKSWTGSTPYALRSARFGRRSARTP